MKKCMMCAWGYPVNERGNHEMKDYTAGVPKEVPCTNPIKKENHGNEKE